MPPTAKEVVEAIDEAINAIDAFGAEFSSSLEDDARIIATLRAHRASLLEKGGPDAHEEARRDALADGGRVEESDADQGAGQGEQMDVAQSAPAPAPLEKGARFSDAELLVLRRALRILEGWRDTYTTATRDADAATLRRMLDGDDTPGGRM